MPDDIGTTWVSGYDAFRIIWDDVRNMRRRKIDLERRQALAAERKEKAGRREAAPAVAGAQGDAPEKLLPSHVLLSGPGVAVGSRSE